MIDATSGSAVDDGPAGTTELVVEVDIDRQSEQAHKDAHGQIAGSACSMTLQVEQVPTCPDHRFAPLAEGSSNG